MQPNALGRTIAGMALLLLGACGSGTSAPVAPGDHCGHPADCPPGTACICPGGARSCGDAVCTELCQDTPGGPPACPSTETCTPEGVACCEGISSCTLNCMLASVCTP
jgi:hypothetical protein